MHIYSIAQLHITVGFFITGLEWNGVDDYFFYNQLYMYYGTETVVAILTSLACTQVSLLSLHIKRFTTMKFEGFIQLDS